MFIEKTSSYASYDTRLTRKDVTLLPTIGTEIAIILYETIKDISK